jgi:UDP-N-acetylmuramoyl-tripeptide--D-alanyl-D-alanine ligase
MSEDLRTLGWAATAVGGRLHGADRAFGRVSTDSRTLAAGELFVALTGPNFDGHAFAAQAAAAGAAGAIVARRLDLSLPQIVVEETRLALGRLAHAWRARFSLPLIGVTGSNGKTTTKQMLTGIMSAAGRCHATRGNFNNDVGLPLTLLDLDADHRSAVIEMGANHRGEIAYLAGIAAPTVGLVTNAGPAHLEGFGGLDGVAAGKGELYEALPATGVAVINADDHYADHWRRLAGTRRVVTFGYAEGADFRGLSDDGEQLECATPFGRLSVRMPVPGAHNRRNALAAMAAASAAGARADHLVDGLARCQVPGGRLALVAGTGGVQLCDDTYNANPASMRAALDWARGLARPFLFVMGDMGELGTAAPALHAEVGVSARAAGARRMLGIGPLTAHAVAAFGAGASHHAHLDELLTALRAELAPGLVVLVKGSRSARMERVVDALRESPSSGGTH